MRYHRAKEGFVGDHKLVRRYEDGARLLFDLRNDPGERHDLAAEDPARVQDLERRLDAYLQSIQAGMPAPTQPSLLPSTLLRSVTLRSVLATGALLLSHLAAQGVAAARDLYITEEAFGQVLHHDGETGAAIDVFTTVSGQHILGIHTSDTVGHVLIGSTFGGVSERHRDTGALIRTYNPSGWQWAGVYAPNGDVLIGDLSTNDVRRYDSSDGSLIGVFGSVPKPADMRFGPNGNLFVCSLSAGVYELNGSTGALVAVRASTLAFTYDIAFLPDGRRILTAGATNSAHVFNASWTPIATFAGVGWGAPHGIDISPYDGNIYVVDGATHNVHAFNATTYLEFDPSFVTIDSKPVDLEFRRPLRVAGGFSKFGSGCAGLTLHAVGRWETGTSMDLHLRGRSQSAPAFLLIGGSATTWNNVPLPLRLDAVGATGCVLYVSVDVVVFTMTDAQGLARVPLTIPADPGLIGSDVYFQWLAQDQSANPLGLGASDAAVVHVGG